jgi:hypothetical protein
MKTPMILAILIPMVTLGCEESTGSLQESTLESSPDADTAVVDTGSDSDTAIDATKDGTPDSGMDTTDGAEPDAADDIETVADMEEATPVEWSAELCKSDEDRGYAVGEVMASLDFYSCDGEVFSTENLCGAKATWLFIVHAWCGECRKLSEEMEAIAKEYVPQGVAVVQLLVHSYEHQLPTSTDCQEWAEEFGLEETLTLYDPVVKNILLQESQQTGLSVFLDSDQRIVSKEHFYDPESVGSTLDSILGQ